MSRENRDELRDRLGDEVRAHQQAIDAFDEAVAARLGINRTDLRCLDVLIQEGSATAGRLATRLGLTTGSVTAMLDRLERLGYLSRSPDPSDRRRVVVAPTDAVVERAAALYGPLVEEGAHAIAGYTSAELELLIGFLRMSREVQEHHVERVRGMGRPGTVGGAAGTGR